MLNHLSLLFHTHSHYALSGADRQAEAARQPSSQLARLVREARRGQARILPPSCLWCCVAVELGHCEGVWKQALPFFFYAAPENKPDVPENQSDQGQAGSLRACWRVCPLPAWLQLEVGGWFLCQEPGCQAPRLARSSPCKPVLLETHSSYSQASSGTDAGSRLWTQCQTARVPTSLHLASAAPSSKQRVCGVCSVQ